MKKGKSRLKAGELRYTVDGEERAAAVGDGFIEVLPDRVVVISDFAERPEDIDIKRAQRAKERAEERIRLKKSEKGIRSQPGGAVAGYGEAESFAEKYQTLIQRRTERSTGASLFRGRSFFIEENDEVRSGRRFRRIRRKETGGERQTAEYCIFFLCIETVEI